MRIAFFTDSLPPLTDGVTRTLSELATTLEDAGIEFRFVSAVRPDASVPWRRHVRVVPSVPLPLYRSYRVGVPVAPRLVSELDVFAPDIVHVVTPSPLGLWGVSYAERRGIPTVGSFHTDFASCLRFYGLGCVEALAWRCAKRLHNRYALTLAPSAHVAETLLARGIRNVALWKRGVDPTQFSPAFRSPGLRARVGADAAPILLYVGRLCREKNLDALVLTADELRRAGVAHRLVLVGDGPLAGELRERLPDALFTGVQRGDDLASWYASADLFVFPSVVETFGNVVLEAFSSGVPVVAFDAGGVRELVASGRNGLLVSPDSPSGLADAVSSLLADRELRARLSRGALATATRHRWPEVNRALLVHYARLVGAQQGKQESSRRAGRSMWAALS